MTQIIFCGCAMMSKSERRERSRWWNDSPIVRCVVVLTLLTFPTSLGLEEAAHLENSPTSTTFYWAEVNLTYIDPVTKVEVHETSKGKYGAKSLVERRTGLAVHVRNKENKTHGCDEYDMRLPREKWIALVERGHCYFTDKIKVATKKYNASAVVIYNNEGGAITIMQHTVEDQVSIFVSQDTGRKLAGLADLGVRVIITITPGNKEAAGSAPQNSISKTSVLFVSISFIVLMIISLAWLVFYYIQRFRYAHAKERLARRLASAAKKAISHIPQKTIKNGDKELDSEFDQCAVCIESYKPHDVIRTLPCKHVFHKSCVDPWLLDQRSCPMCKLDILRAFGMQVFGSQESVHQDAESGGVVGGGGRGMGGGLEDREASSTTDDQPTADNEVTVLLLPHSCLHFHSSSDPTVAPGNGSPTSPVPEECRSMSSLTHAGNSAAAAAARRSSSSSAVKQSSSADRLSHLSLASSSTAVGRDAETRALISSQHDEDDDEDDEGFKECGRGQGPGGDRKATAARKASGGGAKEDSDDDDDEEEVELIGEARLVGRERRREAGVVEDLKVEEC